MMACGHMTFAVAVLALVASGALLGYASKIEVCCKSLIKGIAYAALVLSALNLLCFGYMTIKSCGDNAGCDGSQCPMKAGKRHGPMGGQMQMPPQMMPPAGGSENPPAPNSDDH